MSVPAKIQANIDLFRRNLAGIYAQATTAEVEAGRDWYPSAHAKVATWAGYAERSIANVATMVAVLSPQCSWENNLQCAEELLLHGDILGYGPLPVNVEKAKRVLADYIESSWQVMPSGPKVANFAANLAGNYDAVTVDSHMAQACWNDATWDVAVRCSTYDAYALAVRLAADEAGETPAAFQAIVWVAWKRLHPSGKKRHVRRLAHVLEAKRAKRRAAAARRRQHAAIAA